MADLSVIFEDYPTPFDAAEQARVRPLVAALVAASEGHRGADLATISRVAGAASGYGGQLVVLARLSNGPVTLPPLVLRVGPRELIADERRRYERFAHYLLSVPRAEAGPYAEAGADAVLAYAHLHQHASADSLRSLGQHLQQDEGVDVIAGALGSLFAHGLAPGADHPGWSRTAESFAEQRALWFYNAALPPTLALDDISVVPRADEPSPLADLLAAADRPGAAPLGSTITIARSDELGHLEVVPNPRSRTLRLHLFAVPPRGRDEFRRPLEPLLARVELRAPVDPAELARVCRGEAALAGHVSATRYLAFDRLVDALVAPALAPLRDGAVIHNGQRLINPLRHYADLLDRPMSLTTAVIHGDLNLHNILVELAPPPQPAMAWLIDFDRTGSGGHAVFDAVKLETEYKAHILSRRLTPGQLIDLDLALHQALVFPDRQSLRSLLVVREQDAAYELISTLRSSLIDGPDALIQAHEYYMGLLAYGLASLKHRSPATPAAQPMALAAYLSASGAATRLREAEVEARASEPAAGATLMPRIAVAPNPFPRLRQTRRLIGRDAQVRRAVTCLAGAGPRVAVIHGALGMQGHLVALEVADRLFGRYALYPDLIAGIAPEPSGEGGASTSLTTIADLLDLLRPILGAGAAHLDEALPMQGGALLADGAFERLAGQVGQVLDEATRPWLIVLRLERAHDQLLRFVEQLWQRVTRTAFLIVARQGLAASRLPEDHQIALPPWGENEARAALERAALPATPDLLGELLQQSGGVPEVIERMVAMAHLQGLSDPAAVRATWQVRAAVTLDAFAAEIIGQWSDAQLRMVGLDAFGEETLGASWRGAREQLRRARALAWDEAEARQFLDPYRGDLRDEIRRRAQEALLASSDGSALLKRLGGILHQGRLADRPAMARWFARAGEWSQAADILVQMVEQRESLTVQGCEQLYELAQQVRGHVNDRRSTALTLLAGTCAAYLGQFDQAIKSLSGLAHSTTDNELRVRCYAQLLQLYRERSDEAGLALATRRLRGLVAPASPFAALAAGYDPDATPGDIRDAVALLDRGEPEWSMADAPFLAHQRVLLIDRLAEGLYRQGEVEQASAELRRALALAQTLQAELLVARIKNNLGLIAFFDQADVDGARGLLEDAARIRHKLGDRVGQLRTIQNLASIKIELAAGRAHWDEARSMLGQYLGLARQIDSGNSPLLLANLLELLVRSGDTASYAAHYSDLPEEIPDPTTERLLLLNRAKAALWNGQGEQCAALLATAHARLGPDDLVDSSEWLQLRAEGHLRGLLPPLDDEVLHLARLVEEATLPPPWLHDLELTAGLVALATANPGGALSPLERAHKGWSRLRYRFKAAVAQLWYAVALARSGQLERAEDQARKCATALKPFGATTPALRLLHQLQATTFQEIPHV